MADSTAQAIQALRKQQQRIGSSGSKKPRIIVMNALSVGESHKVAPLFLRLMMDYTNVGKTWEDHSAVDAEIEDNCGDDVHWTVVYVSVLAGSGNKPVKTFSSDQSGFGWLITRESCARWMIDAATEESGDKFTNARVIVSN
ncbi:hypothetical protein PFICI_05821 [Pestalotiopsis fici W106-1]|uniref:Uncharacterized protein n=1 Tax=Pestalotiopsis fici (strain W106-1 / CGMCC3.15140) TaxID=1229662 RepID=W3XD09_PESFW|nr:uncharacterized protein PFICI_05821 [Pestalotiopsis fici W106-1]ETS83945.1 hypothetical protein PFICI_05821 [Pestalotiopsis fici W106-1]